MTTNTWVPGSGRPPSPSPYEYSTLEVAQAEHNGASAPQADLTQSSPQPLHYDHSPELVQRSHTFALPQAVDGPREYYKPEDSREGAYATQQTHNPSVAGPPSSEKKKIWGFSRKVFWILIALVVLLIVALAVGLGVGLGIKKSSTTTTPPPASSPSSTPTPQSDPGSTPSNSTTVGGTSPLLVDDTSFAALAYATGLRRVFFQDTQGDIRQAVYDKTANTWATSDVPVATYARNHTPIGAFNLRTELFNAPGTDDYPCVFYVTPEDSIGFQVLESGAWVNTTSSFGLNDLPNYNVSKNIRALTAASSQPNYDYDYYGGFQEGYWSFYDLNDKLVALRNPNVTDNEKSVDLAVLSTNTTHPSDFVQLDTPTSAINVIVREQTKEEDGTDLPYPIYYYIGSTADDAKNLTWFYSFWFNGTSSHNNQDFGTTDQYNLSDSDFVTVFILNSSELTQSYHYIVNGPTLINLDDRTPQPLAPWNYGRFAGASVVNQTAFQLYHQLNSTTIVEETFDSIKEEWTSVNITVLTAND